jgi:Protein of unknown function (DUF1064)
MPLASKNRKSKYGAKPVIIDSIRFASMSEGRRYRELKLMQRAGEISGLECHPKFSLDVKGMHVCTYIADFMYIDSASGLWVVEDVKGVKTALYALKKKLMLACLGIEIVEIRLRGNT